MDRHLVLGNQTLLSPDLYEVLASRADGDAAIHLVVPQTPLDRYHRPFVDLQYRFRGSSPSVQTVAEHQLEVALQHLSTLDAEVTGELGDPDPFHAASRAIASKDWDEIIVSTLPLGASAWLGMDVVARLERHGVPVTHVECRAEPPSATSRRRYDELRRQLRAT